MLSEQEKAELKKLIKSNQHEVFIVSIEEMDAIVRSSPKSQLLHIQESWAEIRDKAEVGANYYASAADIKKLQRLIADLGSPNAQVYVRTYGGKPHIILKGYPGLRKVLTGTKYGIKNPQVVAMGLGKAAGGKIAKSGGALTLVLLSTYRVADYFLTDEATLAQLIDSLATDVVKVGITIGASLVTVSLLGATAFSSLAIGPLLVVVAIGVGGALVLNMIDDHFGLTDKLRVADHNERGGRTAYQ